MITVSKILVPVDFSSGSRIAAEYALALATAFRSTVTLFHVYEKPELMNTIVPGADNAADAERDRAFSMGWIETLRTEVLQGRAEIEVLVVVEHGSPAPAIVTYSRTGGFDMVVMGTHGRTGLRHVLMGSVAEAVVHRAHCPVLTIHFPVPGRPT
jgi:nucleotide-binding universal stress UspA family protein